MASIITKYRPKNLNEIVGQDAIKEKMRMWVDRVKQGQAVPNLLFVGEPGVGKTTMAFAIAHEIFGDKWRAQVLELNASDERGIEVMREKIKTFARCMPSFSDVKINLVILDEADYLTPEAQAILRRLMEDYAKITKFILCCNWLNRIIDPIKDRCAIYRLQKYTREQIKEIVNRVADAEGINANIDDIAYYSDCSVRKALNMLFTGQPVATEVKELVTTKTLKNLLYTHDIDAVIEKVFEQVKEVKDDKVRIKLAMKLMDAEYHIKFGCNPYLQLYGVVAAWEKILGM